MSCYLIEQIDKNVSVAIYEENEFESLRNNGEESWEYLDSSFWNWFKEKTEYSNEELSFIVLSDDKFEIDSTINVSNTHHLTNDTILELTEEYNGNNLEVVLFPKVDFQILPKKIQPIVSPNQKTNPKKPINGKKLSLQKHFQKQTRNYKK